ncbi:MAG: hypothetical protein ACLQCU_08940 [Acidimicrobiales bacterium]
MSDTLDRVIPVRMSAALVDAVRKAAEREGSRVSKIGRELFEGYAKEAGTLPEPTYRKVNREKVA